MVEGKVSICFEGEVKAVDWAQPGRDRGVRERGGMTEEDQEKGPRKHMAEMVEFYRNENLGEVKPMSGTFRVGWNEKSWEKPQVLRDPGGQQTLEYANNTMVIHLPLTWQQQITHIQNPQGLWFCVRRHSCYPGAHTIYRLWGGHAWKMSTCSMIALGLIKARTLRIMWPWVWREVIT